jgi:putative spermidine/putrescine transport system permease protein
MDEPIIWPSIHMPPNSRSSASSVAWQATLIALPGTFLLLMLGLPLFWIVRLSLGYPGLDLNAYVDLVESGVHLRVVAQTVVIAALSTLLALILGYPAAYVMAKLASPWRQIALCIVSLPLWTSLLVRTYAWIIILAPGGPINRLLLWIGLASEPLDLVYNRTGTILGLTHSVLPYLILPIYASFLKLDGALVRAAASLGGRPSDVFFRVVLPLTLPGIASGCLFAFLLGLGAFVIPALLGGPAERTIAMMIESTSNQQLNWNLAAALALELLVATLAILFLQHRLFGLGTLLGSKPDYNRLGRLLRPLRNAWRKSLGGWPDWRRKRAPALVGRRGGNWISGLMTTVAICAFVFLALPLAIVIPVSFSAGEYLQFPPPGFSLQWYVRYLTSSRWLEATALSISIGCLVVAVSLLIGVLAAIAAARMRRLGLLLGAACLSPMMLPNMIVALGLYFALSKLQLVGTVVGLVLAHSLLALPFVFVTVTAGLREIDPNLERAAAVLGARPFATVVRITLPLLRPFLLTAALFAFIVSFDEIVASLFLTSVSVRTLPKMIWENIIMFMDPTISAVSVLLIVVSSVLLLASQALQRSRPPAR